jgi:hypothetical protein
VHAGVDYVISEGGPDGKPYLAEWLSSTPQPDAGQLQEALEKLSNVRAADDLADLRKAEYPGIEEQLEAAYEARQGDDTRQKELDARITEIREKYPKSDESL